MAVDPVKVAAGSKGGTVAARRRCSHLTDAEYEVMREMQRQVASYGADTAGAPAAVAAWLRGLADDLDGGRDVLILSRQDRLDLIAALRDHRDRVHGRDYKNRFDRLLNRIRDGGRNG